MSFTGTVKVGNSVALSPTGLLKEGNGSGLSKFTLEAGDSQSRLKTTSHRAARVGKGRLSSGVVFLVELEGNGIPWLGSNGAWLERQGTRAANDNTMIGASAGGRGRRRAHGRGRGGSGLRRRYGARRIAVGHCGCFEGGELVPRVHGEDHPLLTVTSLPAVRPNRIAALDEELSGGEGPCRIVGGNWYTISRICQSRNNSYRGDD